MMLHTKYQGIVFSDKKILFYVVVVFFNLKVKQRAKVRNRYNQLSQLTLDTILESDITQENTTHNRAKKSALFHQVITFLCKICHLQECAI